MTSQRLDWADSARGLSILLVVMMHSTLGVQEAFGGVGWLNPVVEFAKPFRVPAFFLISGLFFARALERPLIEVARTRLMPLVYLFALWSVILLTLKGAFLGAGSLMGALQLAALSIVEPHGSLWFIHALVLFSLALFALRRAPALLVIAGAAALHLAAPETGWIAVDEFTDRFVYFAAGCLWSRALAEAADGVWRETVLALATLALGAMAVAAFVWPAIFGFTPLPAVLKPAATLLLGGVGALATLLAAAFLAPTLPGRGLAFLGRNTLPIYLAFTIPMAAAKLVLLKTGLITDVGAVSLIVTLSALLVPLVMAWAANRLGLRFLFELPSFAAPARTMRAVR
jgi:uncharacterized membrane protein YcfT